MTETGPPELGRGVVINRGAKVPAGWRDCPRVIVEKPDLLDPGRAVAALQDSWAKRRPTVVELGVDAGALRADQLSARPAYLLGAEFSFPLERLHFLVWANNYDARSGTAIWWHARKAARRWAHAGVRESALSDLVMADGSATFVDGGPAFALPLSSGTTVVHRYVAEEGQLPLSHSAAPRMPTTGDADLAPDQLAAVLHGSGPARVIAPAGSGKTRVLTERLRHLVCTAGTPARAVTVLAFNTLAAQQLRERAADVIGPDGPHIRTINSLGLWICNELGGRGPLRLAEQSEVRELVQRLFGVRRQSNVDPVAPYLEALSAVRLGLVAPEAAEIAFPDATGLAAGFDDYRAALAEARALDFDEQIYRAVEILLGDPTARRTAAARCRWLLVDEFQDLHPAHLLLVRLLSAPAYDCFAVGDDDQVLYGYSGATPEYLIGYSRLFPGAAEHALEVNYRCPTEVVDAARHLLTYNERRVAKVMRASGTEDRDVQGRGLVVRSALAEDLATEAVAAVAAWVAAGVALDDVAILARVNAALLPVQVALDVQGVACVKLLSSAVLDRTGIRTALAYLRIGCNPGAITRQDVLETIRRPSRGLAPQVVEMLTARAKVSLDDVAKLGRRLSGRDTPKLAAYVADLQAVVAASAESSASALRAISAQVGLGATMELLDSSRTSSDRSTHGDDLAALEAVASMHPETSTFGTWLRSTLEQPQRCAPAVILSSVHRVKGREWGHVVVYGVSRGWLPHRASEDAEGERRVLHVAMTRARTQALLLAEAGAESEFLAELDGTAPRHETPRRRPRARPEGPVRVRAGEPRPGSRSPSSRSGHQEGAAQSEESLKAWRRGVAARSGVPAYVVLNDAELAGVAARRPSSLAELATCRGMGPIRLERWGDEILAVLDGDRVTAGDP